MLCYQKLNLCDRATMISLLKIIIIAKVFKQAKDYVFIHG